MLKYFDLWASITFNTFIVEKHWPTRPFVNPTLISSVPSPTRDHNCWFVSSCKNNVHRSATTISLDRVQISLNKWSNSKFVVKFFESSKIKFCFSDFDLVSSWSACASCNRACKRFTDPSDSCKSDVDASAFSQFATATLIWLQNAFNKETSSLVNGWPFFLFIICIAPIALVFEFSLYIGWHKTVFVLYPVFLSCPELNRWSSYASSIFNTSLDVKQAPINPTVFGIRIGSVPSDIIVYNSLVLSSYKNKLARSASNSSCASFITSANTCLISFFDTIDFDISNNCDDFDLMLSSAAFNRLRSSLNDSCINSICFSNARNFCCALTSLSIFCIDPATWCIKSFINVSSNWVNDSLPSFLFNNCNTPKHSPSPSIFIIGIQRTDFVLYPVDRSVELSNALDLYASGMFMIFSIEKHWPTKPWLTLHVILSIRLSPTLDHKYFSSLSYKNKVPLSASTRLVALSNKSVNKWSISKLVVKDLVNCNTWLCLCLFDLVKLCSASTSWSLACNRFNETIDSSSSLMLLPFSSMFATEMLICDATISTKFKSPLENSRFPLTWRMPATLFSWYLSLIGTQRVDVCNAFTWSISRFNRVSCWTFEMFNGIPVEATFPTMLDSFSISCCTYFETNLLPSIKYKFAQSAFKITCNSSRM